MSKILFDTFTYRWRKIGDSYYFGRNTNNNIPQFERLEKEYFLSKLITSLLIHEKIIIKLDSLEELELLIGIDNVLRLFNDEALEIIDDGGTMVGFMVGSKGENLLMNFNSCTGLQIDSIERRLGEKYKGRIENRKVQPLLLNVEKKKIDVDGAWIGHLVEEELEYDFNNRNLTQLLNIQSEGRFIISDRDMLSTMRLCYLNRGLIYQNEVNADFLLTEEYSKVILQSKISPRLGVNVDPNGLFLMLSEDKGIPDLAKLVLDGIIRFEHILELRNSIDGKKFRKWFEDKDYDKKMVYEELMKFNSSITSNSWLKIIRWIYPNLIGFANPIAGLGASAIDSFVVDKMLKGWHPNLFLDEKLKNHIDAEIKKNTQSIEEMRTYKRLGRKVGRNEICPCGSGEKFKKCCGKELK